MTCNSRYDLRLVNERWKLKRKTDMTPRRPLRGIVKWCLICLVKATFKDGQSVFGPYCDSNRLLKFLNDNSDNSLLSLNSSK